MRRNRRYNHPDMSGSEDPLVFPCAFPLKVVGRNDEAFERAVREVLRKHLGDIVVEFVTRKSSGGKYLSVTATFTAGSREQVDAIYRELNGHDLVVMTL